jgi:two-component system, LytTR family, sensor kinase
VTDRPDRRPTAITLREFARVSFAVHTGVMVLNFLYRWLDDVVRARTGTFVPRLVEEGTGAYSFFVLSGILFLAWRAAPLRGPRPWRLVPVYLLLALALSAASTSLLWASRSLLFPLLGLGSYDYGRMPLRYLMEAPAGVLGAAVIVGVLALVDEVRERRARAAAQVALERAFTEAQLRNLRLQLQPHFLFNALNTIASRVHDDPMHADRLIGRLADLLRVSYRRNDAALVPFREELALLEAYTDLMRARFGESLLLEVHAGTVHDEALVPPLLLQPLVENAVRHGRLERDGQAHIRVEAHAADGRIALRVFDDGPGVTSGAPRFGTGLSTTAQRLALLFGREGKLTVRNADGGGFEVQVELPMRTS